ncbi:MAG TPA: hypothetical protein VIJ14_07730 [Rhabdochlamydiaceae bacterium]
MFLLLNIGVSTAQQASIRLKAIEEGVNAASKAGRYAEAASLMQQLIGMGAKDSSSYYGEAVLFGLAGDMQEGRLYFDTAIARGWVFNEGDIAVNLLKIGPTISSDSMLSEAEKEASRMPVSAGSNAEIHKMYEDGEIARIMSVRLDRSHQVQILTQLMRIDAEHRLRVKTLSSAGKLKSKDDFHEAAFMMHLGVDSSDFLMAMRLADSASFLGDVSAKSLFAHAEDKYLISIGKAQKYGTQFYKDEKTGKLKNYLIDPKTTDSARKRMGLPPLKVLRREAKAFYGS